MDQRSVLGAVAAWSSLVVMLGACGFVEDLMPKPPEPVDRLPEGTCNELQLEPTTTTTTDLGSWSLGFESSTMSATSVLLPVPAGAKRNSAFDSGPDTFNNRYPPVRQYFGIDCDGRPGVVWQTGTAGEVLLTVFEPSFSHASTFSLPSDGQKLLAATFGDGRVYYLTAEWGAGDATQNITADLRLHAFALSADPGDAHSFVQLDASPSGLNMIVPSRAWDGHAALAFNEGRLALIISRLMHRGADGLNHQGGTAAVFAAETLAVISMLGQTSGHSFGTYMAPTSGGRFVAIDHGDNYPRAVNLHMLNAGSKVSHPVYTFKTLHGTTPTNPAGNTFPVFEEISGEQTYYRWSNDNNIYGEIGAVLEFDDGYLVAFIGEPDENGFSLRNDKAVNYVGDARNIGIVKVVPDFHSVARGPRNVVPDELVLSGGPGSITETGGFYNFGGGWDEQRNAGVRWITGYEGKDAQNASRLAAVRVGQDATMLLWETWTLSEYVETNFAVIDTLGQLLTPPTTLGPSGAVRLSRSDDPLMFGDRTYLFNGRGNNLEIIEIGIHR